MRIRRTSFPLYVDATGRHVAWRYMAIGKLYAYCMYVKEGQVQYCQGGIQYKKGRPAAEDFWTLGMRDGRAACGAFAITRRESNHGGNYGALSNIYPHW